MKGMYRWLFFAFILVTVVFEALGLSDCTQRACCDRCCEQADDLVSSIQEGTCKDSCNGEAKSGRSGLLGQSFLAGQNLVPIDQSIFAVCCFAEKPFPASVENGEFVCVDPNPEPTISPTEAQTAAPPPPPATESPTERDDDPPVTAPPSISQPENDDSGESNGIEDLIPIIGAGVGGVVLFAILALFVLSRKKRKPQKTADLNVLDNDEVEAKLKIDKPPPNEALVVAISEDSSKNVGKVAAQKTNGNKSGANLKIQSKESGKSKSAAHLKLKSSDGSTPVVEKSSDDPLAVFMLPKESAKLDAPANDPENVDDDNVSLSAFMTGNDSVAPPMSEEEARISQGYLNYANNNPSRESMFRPSEEYMQKQNDKTGGAKKKSEGKVPKKNKVKGKSAKINLEDDEL